MADFSFFYRFPLEIRIRLWELVTTEDRVVKVYQRRDSPVSSDTAYWSPTPAPGVSRACREARKYCSYQKAFVTPPHAQYIWVNFATDVIQLRCSSIAFLAEGNTPEKSEIKRLRVDLSGPSGSYDSYVSEFFYHIYSNKICYFPNLERCDVLVYDGLYRWGNFISETYWGACPKSNVRMIDAKTGEWIDEETDGPYQEYVDTGFGATRDYVRYVDGDSDSEEDEGRYEAMMKMKEPLPRVNLDY